MTTEEIKQSIASWTSTRENAKVLNKKFQQGNSFSYDVPPYADASSYLHVYPGLFDGQLLFFVIPAEYDNEQYAEEIDKYTIVCPAENGLSGGHNITPTEANARILAWEEHHVAWIQQKVNTVDGVFQAFEIATEDFEAASVVITLGLKKTPKAELDFNADMIVTNKINTQLVYDDFSRPIPPFSSTADVQSFYLLSV
ncbi:hypothetical protein AMR72_00410 [Flavobacterium psychrophilum]|nr:hypothetical protein AMR72_00410 [Flavobacterium psychrophilum]AOE51111.1 hypothetical protein ALW18_00410 [Flavobacterium psychrophilum]